MNAFTNLKIGTKIIAGYFLLIVLMAGVAGVAYWGMAQVTAADDLALKRQADVADVWVMRRHMVDQYGRQADLIINGDPAAIEDFGEAVEAMDAVKDKVRQEVDTDAEREWIADLHERTNLDEDRLATLLARYGTRAEQVAAFLVKEADQPLAHHDAYSRREIEFMVRKERVMHLDDLLLRRTAIALLGELNLGLLDELTGILATVHGWPEKQVAGEKDRTVEILKDRFGISL